MTSVTVMNGPNLNLLGTRKPEVYGSTTLADVERMCRQDAEKLGLELVFLQSNHEGQLVDWIHETGAKVKTGDSIGAVYSVYDWYHDRAVRDEVEQDLAELDAEQRSFVIDLNSFGDREHPVG